MHQSDFEAFQALLRSMHVTFGGRELTDELMQSYWQALKDQSFSVIERVARQHMRYGKFFPKPVELRPREERTPASVESNGTSEVDLNAKALHRMDWDRVDSPIAFAIAYNIDVSAKRLVGLKEGMPGYAEALQEDRYWRDMRNQPFAKQCEALPTFAAEHDMTRAQRIERMKYIQAKRAEGIKANQLVFPRAVPAARIPPEATRGPD